MDGLRRKQDQPRWGVLTLFLSVLVLWGTVRFLHYWDKFERVPVPEHSLRQLQAGRTKQQVANILGDPEETFEFEQSSYWYYYRPGGMVKVVITFDELEKYHSYAIDK